MRYEIVNPSDKCFIESDDELIACISVLVLGNCAYGLRDLNGECVMPIFLLGGADEWVASKNINLEEYLKTNTKAISKCLRTVTYNGERTSMNNIQSNAFKIADILDESEDK